MTVDTREPALEKGDRADAIFRPSLFPPGIPRDTPWADRPRIALPTVRAHLDVGDYSMPGWEHRIVFERKSGADLLQTLFGEETDALGERAPNLERFRAEIARAQEARIECFRIVCEVSVSWLFAEAERRSRTYGKGFDPFRVLEILDGFATEFDVETIWAGSKAMAEIRVGTRLRRAWEQGRPGKAAKKALARGSKRSWLPVAPPDPNALRVPARGMNRDGSMPEGSGEG